MKKQLSPYYNVMTSKSETEATILIYNYIGEFLDWDMEVGYKQVGTTDIGFVSELEELSKKYQTIHVRINSLGGEIFHGNAIVNAIKNCKSEVHTWNDGVCASMAGMIWLAGHKRHMAKNSMCMLHSASMVCWGNAKDMREMADMLDKFDTSLIIAAADATGMSEDDLRTRYFDGKDHWLNFNDVAELGWASKEDDFKSENPLPANKALNYRELLAAYEHSQHKAPRNDMNLFEKAKEIFEDAKAAIREVLDPSSPSTTEDMIIEEFKASLKEGKLRLEDVQAHLSADYPPQAVATAAEAEPAEEEEEEAPAIKAIRAEMATQKQDFEARFKALGEQPGTVRATPGLPDTDLPGATNAVKTPAQILEEENQKLFNAALSGDTVSFSPAITIQ